MQNFSLTQAKIAVVVGLCLGLNIATPPTLPPWNGHNLDSFTAAKALTQ